MIWKNGRKLFQTIPLYSGFFFQHPQIQKKSQYIKYLCCEDVRSLHQWVNGIRIAKVSVYCSLRQFLHFTFGKSISHELCCFVQYGKQLYFNYQEAMKRTEAAHDWSSLSSSSMKSGSSSSSLPGELRLWQVVSGHNGI